MQLDVGYLRTPTAVFNQNCDPVLLPTLVSIWERKINAEEAIVAEDVSLGRVPSSGALKSLETSQHHSITIMEARTMEGLCSQ